MKTNQKLGFHFNKIYLSQISKPMNNQIKNHPNINLIIQSPISLFPNLILKILTIKNFQQDNFLIKINKNLIKLLHKKSKKPIKLKLKKKLLVSSFYKVFADLEIDADFCMIKKMRNIKYHSSSISIK
jgi:hypothetical protein